MNAVSAIARVTSRMDQIQRSFGMPPRSATAFRDHLETASATETESDTTANESTATASVAPAAASAPPPVEYVTLGGTPVVVLQPSTPMGVVSDATVLPPTEEWATLLPERAQPYVEMIEEIASDTGLDPRLLAGLVWAESTFVPNAVSSAGAIGLAQLMPGTAAGLGVDPWEPEANLRGGATYLSQQIERFGTAELGLAAYNAGPGRVIEYDGAPPFTEAYIDRVLGYFSDLGGTT